MAKYGGGQFSLFLVDGYSLLASLSENANIGKESITQQTNPFKATSEEHTPVNLTKGILNVGSGFYDEATDVLHDVIGTISRAVRIVVVGMEGNVIGKHFVGYQGVYDQKWEVQDVKDGMTKANAQYLISGDIDEGVIVQHLFQYSASWDTKTGGAVAVDAPVDYTLDSENRSIALVSNTLANPTVITTLKPHGLITGQKIFITGSNSTPSINGVQTVTVISTTTFSVPVNVTVAGTAGFMVEASSVGGGVGYLQVSQYAGLTGVIHKIMHSPDDITYAALVTFTNITAIGKERIAVTGNVDRYLSSQGTVTGAGTITSFMGFSRL